MNSSENTKMVWKSFDKIASNSILKDNGCNARIIYAGPKSSDSMIIYRILELSRGRYVLEQTVINTHFRSVQTTLSTLNQQHFDKYVPAEQIKHQIDFHPNPKILSVVSYTRDLGNKRFFSRITNDLNGDKSIMRRMCDFYLKWKMEGYLNKRI
jgi:hypothetical protein